MNKYFSHYASVMFVILSALSLCLPMSVFAKAYEAELFDPNEISMVEFDNITLDKSYRLSFSRMNHLPVFGLSGLAWDEQTDTLYAISDRGALFHFRLSFDNNDVMKEVELLEAYPLRDKSGKPLKGRAADAEGLMLHHISDDLFQPAKPKKNPNITPAIHPENDQLALPMPIKLPTNKELLVSFEHQPRIIRYSLAGEYLGEVSLPKALQNIQNYRHPNKALESLTFHPLFGVLTGAEYPLKKYAVEEQQLYNLRGDDVCRVQVAAAENSAITALEVMPDGSVLVLERAWSSIAKPLVITLRKIYFPEKKFAACREELLASLSTADGWYLDNFEGLTHIGKNRYLMVSDDNDNPLQQTLLVQFSITK